MSQYEEMSLARLKCELRKRYVRVTGRKWELFQKSRTAESHTWCLSHISDARTLFQDCLKYLVFPRRTPESSLSRLFLIISASISFLLFY